MSDEPTFFDGPEEFRRWLEEHHASEPELSVGFYRKGTGKQTMSWSESVDQALCFGWIDSQMKPMDEERYKQRFTPRKPGSTWSKVNVAKVEELTRKGLMRPAGLRAFEERSEARTGTYSHEQGRAELPPEYERQLQADADAAAFLASRPASYRRAAIWWVISAKREETRKRRLATLIEDSRAGRSIKHLSRPQRPAAGKS